MRRLARTAAALFLALLPIDAHADAVLFGHALLAGDEVPAGAVAPATPEPGLLELAGEGTMVTLPELLQLAVRQAPALEQARIDIAVAEAQMEAARAIDDYQVNADLTASTNTTTFFLGDMRVRSTRTGVSGEAAITRFLPRGGSVSLNAESAFTRSSDDTGSANEWTDTITANWTQPILRGYGSDVVRADQARARIARDAAMLSRTQAAISVVREVIQAYWDLVSAHRDLAIRKSSLELARERLRITQAAIKGGGTAKAEALPVEQVIATREEDVLGAELVVINRSVELRRLVGMEIGPGQLVLTADTELGVPGREFDLAALIDDAYRTSPELALLETQADSADIEVEVTENGLLPALDLSLTFGPSGTDDSVGDAAVNMVTFDDFTAIGTLSYQQSIGNHGARGRRAAARSERLRIRISDADARAQIAEALAEAVVLAQSAEKRVALAVRAIDITQQNILAEQSRYQLGKATLFDVLQRQDELKQAELRQAHAIVDWHKASTVIASIAGELLKTYGIELSSED